MKSGCLTGFVAAQCHCEMRSDTATHILRQINGSRSIVTGYIRAFARHLIGGLIYLVSILMLTPAFAQSQELQTLESLQQDGRLSLKIWIEPTDNIVARQQVNLIIEVATDKWFTGGTRIGRFEIVDSIALQREKFAVNSTRVVAGQTWSVQQWALTLYPQRGGDFEIPAIPVTLSIASDDPLSSIEGDLLTRPLRFTAQLPTALQPISSWVASPKFSVTEQFNRSLESLKPGDALIRTIRMAAEDLPAMMLPKMNMQDISGIGLYRKLPELADKVNRGDYLAERTEVLTYVFESTGDYQLPSEIFYWWDTRSSELREITLPEHRLEVLGASSAEPVDDSTSGSQRWDWRLLLQGFGMFVVLFGLIVVLRRLRTQRNTDDSKARTKMSESHLRRAFIRACRKQQGAQAISLLYQYLDRYAGAGFEGSVRVQLNQESQQVLLNKFNEIMSMEFNDDAQVDLDMGVFAKQYLDYLEAVDKPSLRNRWAVDLKLN